MHNTVTNDVSAMREKADQFSPSEHKRWYSVIWAWKDDVNDIDKEWLQFSFKFNMMYKKERLNWYNFFDLCFLGVPDYSLWFSLQKFCPANEACIHDCRPSYFPPAFDESANHKENHAILIPPWWTWHTLFEKQKGRLFLCMLFWH